MEENITADLILCDWAEVVGGKLYLQGGAWVSVVADRTFPTAVAFIVHVPFDRTNERLQYVLELLTEDGVPFPEQNPAKVVGDFEVGRPAGMRAGEEQVFSFALKLNGLQFPAGRYVWHLTVAEEQVATGSFVARSAN